jgi:S-adenosylmethionine:tRNA ribosyltransferase-isomerase
LVSAIGRKNIARDLSMRAQDFDYPLPDDRIARIPVDRGSARLLVLDAEGTERHRAVSDLPALLRPGDLLVVNDTRVLPARLEAVRSPGGARIELLLLDGDDPLRVRALARPAKKLTAGTLLRVGDAVDVVVEGRGRDGVCELRFSAPVSSVLERYGEVPLPPYLKRAPLPEDRDWYQTVYASEPGAVAAPTAGLHLTRELLGELESGGVEVAALTLHVGPGTFKPVKVERVEDHHLDAERYVLPQPTARAIERARERGGRVVAVGTTVVRCLEAAALAASARAVRAEAGDSTIYANPVVHAGAGSTDLFIRPGFAFRVVDVLLTNFHLPRSTLLMLVAAFAGKERVLAAYREAIDRGYRFYSYGDAMVAARRCDAP